MNASSLQDMHVVLIPGMRDRLKDHWQEILAESLQHVTLVPPAGKKDFSLTARITAIDQAVATAQLPVLLVAHSVGCVMLAHWAQSSGLLGKVKGALLVTPPDLEKVLPTGYPSAQEFAEHLWTPVPHQNFPFKSIVASSSNDPLCAPDKAAAMGEAWGSRLAHLGAVGHLNPLSGFGYWPNAEQLMVDLLMA